MKLDVNIRGTLPSTGKSSRGWRQNKGLKLSLNTLPHAPFMHAAPAIILLMP